MAEHGALERPHVRLALIRALAAGQAVPELAARHGASRQSVHEFKKRHAAAIADVAGRLDDEFAGLWVASKAARLATYQGQIEHIASLLDPDTLDEALAADAETERQRSAGVNVSTAELMRTQAQALKAIADELGQIPARMQIEHSGALAIQVNGIDVSELT